jgi:uncharacterized membrane protein
VFAIVVTLLVLELRVPQIADLTDAAALRAEVFALGPKFLSFAMSFLFAAVFWVAHHQLFHLLRRSTLVLLWLNVLFLLCLSFIPFPTAMLGEYPANPFAVQFFGASMFATSLSFALLRWYGTLGARLTDGNESVRESWAMMRRSIFGPIGYAAGALVAAYSTTIAIGIFVLIPTLYVLVPIRFYAKSHGPAADPTAASSMEGS